MAKSKKSSVKELFNAVEEFIGVYAANLRKLSKGEDVETPISKQSFDEVMKIVDSMPKLDNFDKIVNGATAKIAQTTTTTETISYEEPKEGANPLEERLKYVQKKANAKAN